MARLYSMSRRGQLTAAEPLARRTMLDFIVGVGPDVTLQAVGKGADGAPGTVRYHVNLHNYLLAVAADRRALPSVERETKAMPHTVPLSQLRSLLRPTLHQYAEGVAVPCVVLFVRISEKLEAATAAVRVRLHTAVVRIITTAEQQVVLRGLRVRALAPREGLASWSAWETLVKKPGFAPARAQGEVGEILYRARFAPASR